MGWEWKRTRVREVGRRARAWRKRSGRKEREKTYPIERQWMSDKT
jgi:hypothetical protein